MTKCTTSYPLPDEEMRRLAPETLAAAARASLRSVYGVEVDFTRDGVARLDALLRTQFMVGRYTAETFPANLALTLGAYLGEVLRQLIPHGYWGQPDADDLYCTELPFLVFSYQEREKQVNVVEDFLRYLWTGAGPSPRAYLEAQLTLLEQLGFPTGA